MEQANADNQEPWKRPRGCNLIPIATFTVFLLLFGCLIIYKGAQAISSHTTSLNWKTGRGIGIGPVGIGQAQRGTATWTGAEAVRMGIGFCAFGAVFIFSGVGMLASLVRGKVKQRPYFPVLTLLSGICLPIAGACFFPFWQVDTSPSIAGFYSVLAISVFAAVRLHMKKDCRFLRYLLPIAIMTTIIAETFFHINILAGVGGGIFFAFGETVIYLVFQQALNKHEFLENA